MLFALLHVAAVVLAGSRTAARLAQDQASLALIGQVSLTVGTAQAGPTFGRIAGVTGLPDGGVAVLDASEPVIRVFTADGRHRHDIGRVGAGPGEFRAPRAMGTHDGALWTWDFALARVTEFASNGRVLETYRVPRTGRGVLFRDGTLGIFTWRSYGSRVQRADTLEVYKTGPRGVETLRILARYAPYRVLNVSMGNGRQMVGKQPFDEPTLLVAATDGTGFAVVGPTRGGRASVRVERFSEMGKLVFARTIGHRAGVPLSDEEIELAVSNLGRTEADNNPVRAAIRRALYLPKTLPMVTGALCSRDGSVWVRHEVGRAMTGPQPWTIVSVKGARDLQLPRGFVPLDADRTWAWGASTDVAGHPIVQRIDLVPAVAPEG